MLTEIIRLDGMTGDRRQVSVIDALAHAEPGQDSNPAAQDSVVRAAQSIEAARSALFPMNFAIEVFALHLRNLLDFFAPRSPRKTEACAHHFFKGWNAPELNVYLREARWMADKHIAHLTSDRTSDVDMKTWAVEPIVYSMVAIIESFASGAGLVDDAFRQLVAERISELPPRRDWTEMPPQPDLATS